MSEAHAFFSLSASLSSTPSPLTQALSAVAGAHAGPGPPPRYITARLRPPNAPDGVADPLGHPLFSARRDGVAGVLVRVGRAVGGPATTTAPPSITAVAAVRAAFHFPGLADVQYAAWDGRPAGQQAGRVGAGGGGGGVEEGPASGRQQQRASPLPGEPLLCVPPSWARTDVPALAPGAILASPPSGPPLDWPVPGPAPPAVPCHAAVVPPPLEGGAPALAAAVAAAAAAAPPPPSSASPPLDAAALVTRLVDAFEARPAWAPGALAGRVGEAGGESEPPPTASSLAPLAPALARLAYRFTAGPWAGLAVRRGYDPRADPAARGWQGVAGGGDGDGDGDGGGPSTVRQLCDLAEGGHAGAAAALEGPPTSTCDAVAGWCERAAWEGVVARAGSRP